MTIAQLNAAGPDAFVDAVGFAFEGSPWIARAAWERRPFSCLDELHAAVVAILANSPEERQVELITAHPDLAGLRVREGRITAESRKEQTSAGLDRLSAPEAAQFQRLNRAYRARFGFPFIICARENTKLTILAALQARIDNERKTEIDTALAEIAKIARLRLEDAMSES